MATMTCRAYRCRRYRAATRLRAFARVLVTAIALVAVLVIGYGEAWMLAQPRGDEPEVTAATYAAEAVYGESAPDAN